jgi:hypothetical protein
MRLKYYGMMLTRLQNLEKVFCVLVWRVLEAANVEGTFTVDEEGEAVYYFWCTWRPCYQGIDLVVNPTFNHARHSVIFNQVQVVLIRNQYFTQPTSKLVVDQTKRIRIVVVALY